MKSGNIRSRFLGAFAVLLLAAPASPALAQATYYTNTDNENNANAHVADGDMDLSLGNASGIHPIEFNIDVAVLPQSSAVLTMRNLDVDEEDGEVDLVYFNGHLLGKLTGANNVWSSTAFNVDPAWVVQGRNLVRIDVDTSGDPTAWVTTSDWGQLLIDGGGAVNGNTQSVQITGTAVNAGNVTINTSTAVYSDTGGTYRLQISLIDPNNNAVTVLSQDFAVAPGTNTTRTASPTYPLNSVSGIYTVQAQLFWLDPGQGNFPVQQDIATAQFTHTANVGASNFNNDTDGDGLLDDSETALGTNLNDADSDNDGLADGAEVGANVASPVDTDGDGIINALDSATLDSDNDGVVDQLDPANGNPCVPDSSHAACLATDSDGDGLTNAQEDALGTNRDVIDTDGDGGQDGIEVGGNANAPVDTDGDGTHDALESSIADTDGDGVSNQLDPANANPCVPNANSGPCLALDSDGDGLSNAQEDALGTSRGATDTDGDGFNDGAEVGGNVNAPVDTDGDGASNAIESAIADSDGDGVVNQNDFANNNPCVPNVNSGPCLATDSDGDGLTNAQEDALGTSRGNPDTDGDGSNDSADAAPLAPCVPHANSAGCLATDSDGDGLTNAQEDALGTSRGDPDTDDDGVNDNVDAAPLNPCVPNGATAGCLAADSDGDGLTNAQEDALGSNRNDPDSDDDGVSDGVEAGANPATPTDSDGDGIPNALESGDRDGDGAADAADTDSDNDGIPDAREAGADPLHPADTDGDGAADHQDRDSDGDGLPDALEGGVTAGIPRDTDGDGTPDYRDLDSDGDTLPDALEGNASGGDQDGDGIDDAFDTDMLGAGDINQDGVGDSAAQRDTDGDGAADHLDLDTDDDGILDSYEGTPASLTDTDGDGVPDARDLDSDDDGRSDVREAGLVDADGDSMKDPGQASTAAPTQGDADALPDFRDIDSNGDGIFDIVTSGRNALDANGDGRVDAGSDSDEDGIRDGADAAPQVFGTLVDADGDSVADDLDRDLDNDGIANDADGSDDTDGDGLPNLADVDSDGDGVSDLTEAGGVDADADGRVDGFANGGGADVNGNGMADSREPGLGGSALPLPDSDGDGIDNHRDLDSDGDGISDVIESGGSDANNDGRQDNPGAVLPRPDTDGDGMIDSLDTDSDNDNIPDSREGRGDSDGDGLPDSLDSAGKLETAVRGTGDFEPLTLLGLLGVMGFVALRRMGRLPARMQMARVLPVVACAALGLQAAELRAAEPAAKGWYAGFDVGMSMVEPRNRGGGYKVDDKQGLGFRVNLGHSWSAAWSAELFYADGGDAGIASDNPSVGHLGDISYNMVGLGVEWVPMEEGRNAPWFPLLKIGAVQISNEASSNMINYEKLNDLGVYLGGGLGLRFGDSWTALAEAVSYDQDELFFTFGLRKRF